MTRWTACVLVAVSIAASLPVLAAPSEFDRIVKVLESETGGRRVKLGAIGLVLRASAQLAHPAGAREMQIAVLGPAEAGGGFSVAQVERAMTRALDDRWHQVLRTSTNDGQSQTIVWVCPGEMTEVIFFVAQPSNGVVTRVKLDPRDLQRWLEHEEGRSESR